MRLFHPVQSLVVSRNLWLILLSKIGLFLNLVKRTSKNDKDSKSVLIFSLALVVVESLVILSFFTKQKLQKVIGKHATTWRQKLAADFPVR
jgi:hypothetical protein